MGVEGHVTPRDCAKRRRIVARIGQKPGKRRGTRRRVQVFMAAAEGQASVRQAAQQDIGASGHRLVAPDRDAGSGQGLGEIGDHVTPPARLGDEPVAKVGPGAAPPRAICIASAEAHHASYERMAKAIFTLAGSIPPAIRLRRMATRG